jgi:hypothetical protein
MSQWFKKHFPRVDKLVDQYGSWATFLGSMWGVMSWVAHSVPTITQYGSGAVAFAGLGVTCVTALAVSASLAMFRYFRPLPPPVTTREATGNPREHSGQLEFGQVESRIEVLDPGEDLGGKRQYFRLWVPVRFKRKVNDVAVRVSALRPLQDLDQSAPQYVWKPFENRTFYEGDILEVVFATMARDRGNNGFYGEDLSVNTCRIGGMSQHLFEIDVLIGSERTTKRVYLENLPDQVYSGAPRGLGRFGNLFYLAEEDHTPFDSEWVRISRDAVAGRITLPVGAARPRGGFGLGLLGQ